MTVQFDPDPRGRPPFDYEPAPGEFDLIDIDQVGLLLGGYKRGRIREFMRGVGDKPPLPYVKVGRTPMFSKRQIAWWLQRLQEQVDTAMVDVRRARREQGSA